MGKKAKGFSVSQVLLADGWHGVHEHSFRLVSASFRDEDVDEDREFFRDGSPCEQTFDDWFVFTESGPHGYPREVRGPTRAILALASGERKTTFFD